MYLKIQNGTSTKQYTLTDSCNKPYLHVSNSLLPLTTRTTSGLNLKAKDNNITYRAMEYNSTSESGYYSTSSVEPGNMSSTTALTRSSTSNTVYHTAPETTGTTYLTRSSTSSTVYHTAPETTGTTYLTRESAYDTYSYLSHASYSSENPSAGMEYYSEWDSYTNDYHLSVSFFKETKTYKTTKNQRQVTLTTSSYYASIPSDLAHFVYSYTEGNSPSLYTGTNNTVPYMKHNSTSKYSSYTMAGGDNILLREFGTISTNSRGANSYLRATYIVQTMTRESVSDTVYGTQSKTTRTEYLTRSSTSDTIYGTQSITTATEYLTCSSTSGYSGISSSSYGTEEWQ